MTSETLNMWGKGAITLPKEWRERYGTKHFLAKENEQGHLVIAPIVNREYYEDTDGSFGLRFPMGVHPKELLELWDEAEQNMPKEQKSRSASSSRRKK